MSIALKNKNILVTGGSRGLGAATVERFAAEGCNVAINYLSASARAEALAEKVRATWGVTAVVIQGDVATDAGCVAIVEEAVRALGGLDVVVSNAVGFAFSCGGKRWMGGWVDGWLMGIDG
jgi:NAD(P)-dependent dehydrogenase (short-subunit alcohol dehydrogenase family)